MKRDPWDFSDKIESEILDNHEAYVNELEQDNVRKAERIAALEAELGKAQSDYLVNAQAYGRRIAELEQELKAAKERHEPECQHMQISGADKLCVDGRDRHYCDRHDDHEGSHRCRCGVRWMWRKW